MSTSASRVSALGALIESSGLTQREVAKGIGMTESYVSKLISGGTNASQPVIDDLLAFLTDRLGREVTYEQAFGRPGRRRVA